jgi:hypothetical protein
MKMALVCQEEMAKDMGVLMGITGDGVGENSAATA